MNNDLLSKTVHNGQQLNQNILKISLERIGIYVIVLLLLANVLYFFCYNPNSPYALSRLFWYADFRYWPDWVSGCCWLILAWSVVSFVIAVFVPKNTEQDFWFRRSFYQELVFTFAVLSVVLVWYNFATLPLATIFKPITSRVTNEIDKTDTFPLADHNTNPNADPNTTGKYSNRWLLPTILADILFLIIVARRVWRFFQRRKLINHETKNKNNKSNNAFFLFILLIIFPIILGADAVVPPQKVETSTGIYDVQSKDEIFNFTTEQIRELIKMENGRNRWQTKTPHPVLVYCFEERSFQYTGGRYDNSEIKYRLHVPRKIKSGKKYPLVVHLHGVGEAGTDNTYSLAHLHSVLPLMLGEEQQDFFLLVLQCPPNNKLWNFKSAKDGNLDVAVALTDHVIANHPIDENHLSLFGLSSGGYGVWDLLMKYPDKFAAAVPTSCVAPYNFQGMVALKQTLIWTFRNAKDNRVSIESIQEAMRVVNGSGGFMKLTQFDQGGHAAWRPAMDECNCFGWMIAQKRGSWFNPPPERKIYISRSLMNSFFAFFLPLLFAAGLQIFQRTTYCEQLLLQ